MGDWTRRSKHDAIDESRAQIPRCIYGRLLGAKLLASNNLGISVDIVGFTPRADGERFLNRIVADGGRSNHMTHPGLHG